MALAVTVVSKPVPTWKRYNAPRGWCCGDVYGRGPGIVDDGCRIDLSELSSEPLKMEMEMMDDDCRLKNRGGQVRIKKFGLLCWGAVCSLVINLRATVSACRPALLKFLKPQCDK